MSGESKRLIDVDTIAGVVATDTVFVTDNGVVAQANANTAFGNVNLCVSSLVVGNSSTPITSGITVKKGTMWYDTNYIYVAVADNTVKRASLNSF